MKIGVCCNRSDAAAVMAAGFDYVELSASEMGTVETWDPPIYEGLNVEATNLFFPGGVSIWDGFPNGNYAMTTARRAEELGTKVMVVGSGRQRAYPAEAPWPPIQSAIDLLDMMQSSESPLEGFAKMIEYFQTGPTGITFAPESLNRSETNVGNDCGELARVLQDHGVSYTADSYHLLYEWDSDYREGSLDYPSKGFWNDQIPFLPAHVHLGDLPRVLPNPSDPMIRGFMDRLNELGYDGRISLECTIPEKDYVRAADVLREIIRG